MGSCGLWFHDHLSLSLSLPPYLPPSLPPYLPLSLGREVAAEDPIETTAAVDDFTSVAADRDGRLVQLSALGMNEDFYI